MTKQPLGLRERNRLRTRDEILVAMSMLLGERQFENITIDDVSQRAGVSRGTIYTYFPDGRDQLVRDAYLRIAEKVAADGAERREQHTGLTDRVVALASALVDVAATPEGRFYGLIGSALFGPLGGATGKASGSFRTLLLEDLHAAEQDGRISTNVMIEETVVLLGGAVRELGATVAREPERAPQLLLALRRACDTLFPGASN